MSTDTIEAPEAVQDDVDMVEDALDRQEKDNAELVGKVERILAGEKAEGEEPKQEAGGKEDSPAEGADEGPEELSQAVKDRAKEAGVSDALVRRLHQTGLLEESLAAFDRQLIESQRQTRKPAEKPPTEEAGPDRLGGDQPPPALDADAYDEELVKRDAFFQKRIDELESQLKQLSGLAGGLAKQRDQRFQDWFSGQVAGLSSPDLFGNGLPSEGSPQSRNWDTLLQGYEGFCVARGLDPYDCHPESLRRAYPAMFSEHVFKDAEKTAQRKVVDRLRDAEGRFVNSARPSGRPPAKRLATPEEDEADLLREVQTILDRPTE